MASSMAGLMMSASAMAVRSGLHAPGYPAGIVGMAAHIRATWQAAGMIPMSVVSSMRIAVHTVVHMGSSLGTARDIAPVMAVLTGQRTAVDSAKAVLGLLRLCTFRNHAGNTYLTFLCSILRFQGTFIDRIRDNTASYHGNRNKRNG